MFTLTIDTDNAAFQDSMTEEVGRIMADVVDALSVGKTEGKVRDYNGNVVGEFKVT